MFVNFTFDPEEFMEVDKHQSYATRKEQKINPWAQEDSYLTTCDQTKLPIAHNKKTDILEVCKKENISEEFVNY